MVQVLLNVDGLAGSQADLGSGGDGISPAVSMDGDIAFIVDGLVGVGIVHPDQHVSAAPVDDVLGLVPVEVVGGILSLFQEQQLLGVDLGVFFPHGLAAVADGDEGESDLIEIPLTVVRDVPAQTAVPDFVVFVTFGFPFLRGKMAEGGQVAAVFLAHGLQLPQRFVDFGTLHGFLSFINMNPGTPALLWFYCTIYPVICQAN
ncbi:MAG: hypothetical protein BHW19_05030 [Eubacterium sp. 38_16]|nr:MAG: hypothetical protein BHW19_05030 [Eubacterium sp. 38_16]